MHYYISIFDKDKIEKASKEFYPFEICGILGYMIENENCFLTPYFVKNRYGDQRYQFKINNKDILLGKLKLAEKDYKYCGFFHSHPRSYAKPSIGDRNYQLGNSLWLIYSVCYRNLKLYKWNSYKFSELILEIK
jgi:proteasome lid subunit RPN8/RPN11